MPYISLPLSNCSFIKFNFCSSGKLSELKNILFILVLSRKQYKDSLMPNC